MRDGGRYLNLRPILTWLTYNNGASDATYHAITMSMTSVYAKHVQAIAIRWEIIFLSVPAWVGIGIEVPIRFGIMDKLENQEMAGKLLP